MKINPKNKQAGMGMVDAIAALFIITLMVPMLSDMMDRGFQYVNEKMSAAISQQCLMRLPTTPRALC